MKLRAEYLDSQYELVFYHPNPTPEHIVTAIELIDWNRFAHIALEMDEHNWLDGSGSMEPGTGLAMMLSDNVIQHVSETAPPTPESMIELFTAYLEGDLERVFELIYDAEERGLSKDDIEAIKQKEKAQQEACRTQEPSADANAYENLRWSYLCNGSLEKVSSFWNGEEDESSPWYRFAQANEACEADPNNSKELLTSIATDPDSELRISLWAWHCLRALGVEPAEEIRQAAKGLVVEVGMPDGLDVVAVYSDYTARYFNFSGAVIAVAEPLDALKPLIDNCLQAAQAVADNVPRHEGDGYPPIPEADAILLNVITPGGNHFGGGPIQGLAQDQLGGAIIHSARIMMEAMIEVQSSSQQKG